MKIEFYYWDMQCPLNGNMLTLLEAYLDAFEIITCNVKYNACVAKEQNMFFPTLTVVDGTKRYFSPITEKFLNCLLHNEYPQEKPHIIHHGSEIYLGGVIPLTQHNMRIAGRCTGRDCSGYCDGKIHLLSEYGLNVFGFINIEGDNLLGGVEYVPSNHVPYHIPKSDDIAFITCAYRSSPMYDYKTAPLNAMERYLRNHYAKMIAITDEIGTFPNGDLEWFLRNGFRDEGVISDEAGYCRLHLVSKDI